MSDSAHILIVDDQQEICDVVQEYLPGEDGLTLARALRGESGIGIIILTGRGETVDRIIGLEMGADDYLPKPFHLRELLAPSGEEIRLTTGEFDLLTAFVNNANQVLSRDRLLDLARNREAGPFDRTIDVQVGRLRRKLEDDPQKPMIIKTVRGTGYIFTPPVEVT